MFQSAKPRAAVRPTATTWPCLLVVPLGASGLDARLERRDALGTALRELVQRFTAATGVYCRVELSPDLAVPPALAAHALRVVGEGLSNCARHAGAQQIELRARCEGEELRIELADDGRGFDAQAAPQAGHYGLVGMRERARLAGGNLAIASAPGQGTTLRFTAPIRGSKLISKVIGPKRQWRQYKARTSQLPASYRTTVEALERYLMYCGGGGGTAMFEDLIDLFEQSAANRTPIREIVGEDPVEFIETFARNYSKDSWMVRERERLTRAIERAAGAPGAPPPEKGQP